MESSCAPLFSPCSPLDEDTTQKTSLCWLSTAQQLLHKAGLKCSFQTPLLNFLPWSKALSLHSQATSGTEPKQIQHTAQWQSWEQQRDHVEGN